MGEAKHTPGPWEAEKRAGDEWWFGGRDGMEIVVRPPSEKFGAVCVIGASSAETENDANARLIAAAPELLEALKAFMALDRSFSTVCDAHLKEMAAKGPMARAVQLARAAIAKATGAYPPPL
jgi:hypothetical protein